MYYIAEQHNENFHPEIYRNGIPTLALAKELMFSDLMFKQKQIKDANVRLDVKSNNNGTWYYLRYGYSLQNHTEYMILKEVGQKGYVPSGDNAIEPTNP